MILMEMMSAMEAVIGVLTMEVDKVANQVTDMELTRRPTWWQRYLMKTDMILVINDTYGDDVSNGDGVVNVDK